MKNINELIEITERLTDQLDQNANNENEFCVDLQMKLEQMSWETFKIASELKELLNFLC